MHKHLIVATSIVALAVAISPASAKWGCAARSSNRIWINADDATTKAECIAAALTVCRKYGGRGCHIIGSAANVNKGEADAIWPPPGPTQHHIVCGSPGQPKC
jgi:hypothetical protein